jgi:hypothetical protein
MAKETRDSLRGGRGYIVRIGAGGADCQMSESPLAGNWELFTSPGHGSAVVGWAGFLRIHRF